MDTLRAIAEGLRAELKKLLPDGIRYQVLGMYDNTGIKFHTHHVSNRYPWTIELTKTPRNGWRTTIGIIHLGQDRLILIGSPSSDLPDGEILLADPDAIENIVSWFLQRWLLEDRHHGPS